MCPLRVAMLPLGARECTRLPIGLVDTVAVKLDV